MVQTVYSHLQQTASLHFIKGMRMLTTGPVNSCYPNTKAVKRLTFNAVLMHI